MGAQGATRRFPSPPGQSPYGSSATPFTTARWSPRSRRGPRPWAPRPGPGLDRPTSTTSAVGFCDGRPPDPGLRAQGMGAAPRSARSRSSGR
jgi:hypothetical protein